MFLKRLVAIMTSSNLGVSTQQQTKNICTGLVRIQVHTLYASVPHLDLVSGQMMCKNSCYLFYEEESILSLQFHLWRCIQPLKSLFVVLLKPLHHKTPCGVKVSTWSKPQKISTQAKG